MLKRGMLGLVLAAWGTVAQAEQPPLPSRLVLCLDGVSFRDLHALQVNGGSAEAQSSQPRAAMTAFQNGYFPVSRLVSTFPSCSDVAWTEILGNAPLPGYQRTYFDIATSREVSQNGITTTMEYEQQMHWQVQGGCRRSLGYVAPVAEFKHEVRLLLYDFLHRSGGIQTYYAMLRTTDDAQHLSGNIQKMLVWLDQELEGLQSEYRRRMGRGLEILILSDHGNNHAGPGKRVRLVPYLKKHGYRVTETISGEQDVVLPTVGIQSWVEVHNAPGKTLDLAQALSELEGVELVIFRMPGETTNCFVLNARGECASIQYRPADDCYCYSPMRGDPLGYGPVRASLRSLHLEDAQGFTSGSEWLKLTMLHRYPDALERIIRGLTSSTKNPANILLSLDNHYVHANGLVLLGSRLLTCSGTHGGLDNLNSDGVLLSNFRPTKDTTSSRLAGQFQYFAGRQQSDSTLLSQTGRNADESKKVRSSGFEAASVLQRR